MGFRHGMALVAALATAGLLVPQAGANEYVVDQNHPQASNSGAGTAEEPLKTLSAAVAKVAPGDLVLIKGGVYRESVTITTSGAEGKPITIKAAPGERVVISGADRILGWRKCTREEARDNPKWEKIWVAEMDWSPGRLYVGGNPTGLSVSRWPKGASSVRNSFLILGGDRRRVVDAENLSQPAGFFEGGSLWTYRKANDSQYRNRIVGYDPEKHELTVDKDRPYDPVAGTDRYYVTNLVSIISEPGQYAIDTRAQPYRLFLWPVADVDPNQAGIEGSRRGSGLLVQKASHVIVQDIEVARCGGSGITLSGGRNNQVLRCLVHHCQSGPGQAAANGIAIGGNTDSVVRNCISVLNSYGINCGGGANNLIEGNATGQNTVDAMMVTYGAKGIRVVRNYIFDNWDSGHPDGFQTYRNVSNLVLDSNLFLSVGQGWQSAETTDSTVTNNVWAGIHWGNLLSMSLRKPSEGMPPNLRNTFRHNTLIGGAVSTGGESRFVANICIPPATGGCGGGPPLESDYNLLWYPGYKFSISVPGNARRQQGSFAEYQKNSTRNAHSVFAPPKFRNGPLFEANLSARQASTVAKLYPNNVSGFEVGDILEIDCDGVSRKVTAIDGQGLTIEPPLASHRGSLSIIWNWKKAASLDLDLRLADDSPGKGMGPNETDVGSTINVPAYMRGDFNADGRRDLPALPQDVLGASPSLARYLKNE